MPKYRKKPVVIEAIQYDGTNWQTIANTFTEMSYDAIGGKPPRILTLEGSMEVSVGDYVIRGIAGEHYPCKPDIFEKTYDPA